MIKTMIEICGWVGALLLASCSFPQLYHSYFTAKKVNSLSFLFIIWWLLGEIFTLIFVLSKSPEPQLIFNYGFNILVIGFLIPVTLRK